MRARRFSAIAVTALMLSAAFATAAHAGFFSEAEKKEKQVFTSCIETEADAAFLAGRPQDRDSQRAAWDEIKGDVCLVLWVSFDELSAAGSCYESEQQLHRDEVGAGRGIVERCLGGDAFASGSRQAARKHHAKKRDAKHSRRR